MPRLGERSGPWLGRRAGGAIGHVAIDIQAAAPQDLFDQLSTLLPRPKCGQFAFKKRLREKEFDKISQVCDFFGMHEWALRPRTLVVLFAIGRGDLMDEFVQQRLFDVALPYTESNLPKGLVGESRARFLEYQDNVCTGHGAKLERPGNPHQHIQGIADDLFIVRGRLGHGGSAEVDRVMGRRTSEIFARKRIPRHDFRQKDREHLSLFVNELEALKQLSHKHIVRLIGSYTDSEWVGIIMQPVADMNLWTFLSEEPQSPRELTDRRVRIRSFFGCISSAVQYLHANDFQHKDIKPHNVLVKGSKVYITDFGASYRRTNGSHDTTEGTSHYFTTRYLAPEGARGARKPSCDIWSLGCVFLEMCTVLATRTLGEINARLGRWHDRTKAYYENYDAVASWLVELQPLLSSSESPGDVEVLEITSQMCEPDPTTRPTARELILNLLQAGPQYHNRCCDKDHWADASASDESLEALDDIDAQLDEDITVGSHVFREDEPYVSGLQPFVEDAAATIHGLINVPPKNPAALLEDVTIRAPVDSVIGSPQPSVASKDVAGSEVGSAMEDKSVLSDDEASDGDGILPNQPAYITTQIKRSEHDQSNIQFSPKILPPSPVSTPYPDLYSSTETPQGLHCPWPRCKPPKGMAFVLFDGPDGVLAHLREKHLVHDFGRSRLYRLKSSRRGKQTLSVNTGTMVLSNVAHRAKLSPKIEDITWKDRARRNLQPEQIVFDEEVPDLQKPVEHLINVTIPSAPTATSTGEYFEGHHGGEHPASFVPSYILASRNRFWRYDDILSQRTRPLFVYGTLMFPSILQERARSFMTREGVYSREQGRRLRTEPGDWSSMHTSLEQVARLMTPARLTGYSLGSRKSVALAYLEPQSFGRVERAVNGFLVFGMSDEALSCVKSLYERGGPRHQFQHHTDGKDAEWEDDELTMREVTVSISTAEGEIKQIAAVTLVDPEGGRRTGWNMDHFLRSKVFHRLSPQSGSGPWGTSVSDEEQKIADALGMGYVQLGDYLVQAVMQKDLESLRTLIHDGECDIDAPSAKFGTALQAAACEGNAEMAEWLLRKGASASTRGGEYGSPLIAAASNGHADLIRLLLRYKADLFTPGGKYVSALYQAVDFDNLEITHLLLEKGAWLTTNYSELLDLAAERNNKEMLEELQAYDVRSSIVPLKAPRSDRSHSRVLDERRKNAFDDIDGALAVTLIGEALHLKGQEGKWTGIKGVKLMRIALQRGVDPRILEDFRPHCHSFGTIQKFLLDGVNGIMGTNMKPIKHTNPDRDDEEEPSTIRASVTSRPDDDGRRQNRQTDVILGLLDAGAAVNRSSRY